MLEIKYPTNGERFYSITSEVQTALDELAFQAKDGVLTLFCPHTSCALCLNENYDSSAKLDMENFLKHLAPRQLNFITHTAEGPDDAPSHMKSILLQSSLQIIVRKGKLMLGTWQGIFLAEFRDADHTRKLWLNFSANA